MNVLDLAKELSFSVLVPGEGADREIKGIYCCDLLSFVMGRAKADDAWITVMANVNALAVAVLSDVSCIVLSEGMTFDEECLERAKQQNICILLSPLPTYETAMKITNLLSLNEAH